MISPPPLEPAGAPRTRFKGAMRKGRGRGMLTPPGTATTARWGGTVSGFVRAAGMDGVEFPLTPALSLREREDSALRRDGI
jgi:hypothetical protein